MAAFCCTRAGDHRLFLKRMGGKTEFSSLEAIFLLTFSYNCLNYNLQIIVLEYYGSDFYKNYICNTNPGWLSVGQ